MSLVIAPFLLWQFLKHILYEPFKNQQRVQICFLAWEPDSTFHSSLHPACFSPPLGLKPVVFLSCPRTCSAPLYQSASHKQQKTSLGKVSPAALTACCFSSWDPALSFGRNKADVAHQNMFTVVSMGKWANGNAIWMTCKTAIMINASSAIYFNIWPR